MPGGDGASLDDELGKQAWRMLHETDLEDFTTEELKAVADILKQAYERREGHPFEG
jgi:hypothetical protein